MFIYEIDFGGCCIRSKRPLISLKACKEEIKQILENEVPAKSFKIYEAVKVYSEKLT